MRTTLKILAVAGGLALAGAACRRDPPPSPAYEEAFQRYLSLRQTQRDEVFLSPEMDGVLQQLSTVPSDSRDAAAARELEASIREGQARARAHQEALAAARGVGSQPIQLPTSESQPAPEAPAPVEENPVAQTPEPAYGMTVAQLREQFSRCFEPGEAMHIPGKGLRDIWVLKDLQVCRQLHPKYVTQVVLLEAGKVWGTATPGPRIEFPAPDAGAAGADAGASQGAAAGADAGAPASP